MWDRKPQIEQLTALLRSAEDPFWNRIRYLLHERGFSVVTGLLADCFPDDEQFEFGLMVGADGRVFQFGLAYLHRQVEEGIFSEWVELTDRWQSTPYREQISCALEMLT
jgi:hypothetical protein